MSSYNEIKNFIEINNLNNRVNVLGLVKLKKIKIIIQKCF